MVEVQRVDHLLVVDSLSCIEKLRFLLLLVEVAVQELMVEVVMVVVLIWQAKMDKVEVLVEGEPVIM